MFADVIEGSVLGYANLVTSVLSVIETTDMTIKTILNKKFRHRLNLLGDCGIW